MIARSDAIAEVPEIGESTGSDGRCIVEGEGIVGETLVVAIGREGGGWFRVNGDISCYGVFTTGSGCGNEFDGIVTGL